MNVFANAGVVPETRYVDWRAFPADLEWFDLVIASDVLYEKEPYMLPFSLEIGDKVLIEGTGAYTTTYASVAFNGFDVLRAAADDNGIAGGIDANDGREAAGRGVEVQVTPYPNYDEMLAKIRAPGEAFDLVFLASDAGKHISGQAISVCTRLRTLRWSPFSW